MPRLLTILGELRRHAPFTAFGALTGILLLAFSSSLAAFPSEEAFHLLHPLHLFLSALVTTAMYRLHRGGWRSALLVGFVGSVAICTLSDIFLPYLGGLALRVPMELHICLLVHPWLVLPAVLLGIGAGLLHPTTRVPHAGHILVSTYASAYYLLSYASPSRWLPLLPWLFPLLFLAVWLPCCTSDIVFPLLFVKGEASPCSARGEQAA